MHQAKGHVGHHPKENRVIGAGQNARVDLAEVAVCANEERNKPDGEQKIDDGPGRGDGVVARASRLKPPRACNSGTDADQEDRERNQIERDERTQQRLDVEQHANRQQETADEQQEHLDPSGPAEIVGASQPPLDRR